MLSVLKGFFCIVILIITACNNPLIKKQVESVQDTLLVDTAIETPPVSKAINSAYYTLKDTVIISTLYGDTLSYSKKEYNDIIANFPALYIENSRGPDIAYNSGKKSAYVIDSSGNKDQISFGSECGQDNYFLLYAYFLKKKNGEAKYSIRRNNLIKIYNDINSIFDNLSYGGTYFGHQQRRIIGYAEYAINWYSERKDFFDKTYDISRQKKLFINTLNPHCRSFSPIC